MKHTITDSDLAKAIRAALGLADDVEFSVVTPGAGKAERDCACGCGARTKSTWAPGHDATHKARLYEQVRAGGDEGTRAAAELVERGWPQPAAKKAKAAKVTTDKAPVDVPDDADVTGEVAEGPLHQQHAA